MLMLDNLLRFFLCLCYVPSTLPHTDAIKPCRHGSAQWRPSNELHVPHRAVRDGKGTDGHSSAAGVEASYHRPELARTSTAVATAVRSAVKHGRHCSTFAQWTRVGTEGGPCRVLCERPWHRWGEVETAIGCPGLGCLGFGLG